MELRSRVSQPQPQITNGSMREVTFKVMRKTVVHAYLPVNVASIWPLRPHGILHPARCWFQSLRRGSYAVLLISSCSCTRWQQSQVIAPLAIALSQPHTSLRSEPPRASHTTLTFKTAQLEPFEFCCITPQSFAQSCASAGEVRAWNARLCAGPSQRPALRCSVCYGV